MRVAKVHPPSKTWPLTLLFALLALAAPQVGWTATADELWPAQVPTAPVASRSLIGKLGVAARSLDAQLQPAVQFEMAFAKIVAGVPQGEWRNELENLSQLNGGDMVAKSVKQLAKTWLARAQMADLDLALRKFYRNNVFFPLTLAALGNDLPEKLRVDPWGEPWFYNQRPPPHFQRLNDQRYQLGPKQYPELSNLKQAIRNRSPASRPWKVAVRELGGTRALEYRSPVGSVIVAQAGGDVEDCKLLFVAPNWALMANLDQLFTVAF